MICMTGNYAPNLENEDTCWYSQLRTSKKFKWEDEYTIYRTLCWPEDLAINGIYINVKAGSYTNTHSEAILFKLLGELK